MSSPAPLPEAAPTGDQAEARRVAILDAAIDLFAEHGYRGATIKAITTAAGLRSPALLYWYFADKDQILRACLERYGPVLPDPVAERAHFDEPPEVFLSRLMRSTLDRFGDPRTVSALRILTTEGPRLAEEGYTLEAARPQNLFSVLTEYLQHQVALGALRPHDEVVAARLIVGQLLLGLQSRGPSGPILTGPFDDDRLIASTIDLLLDGLRPPPRNESGPAPERRA